MRPEDEAEFTVLVERQWRFAYRVAWAVMRNAQDAEDTAQEAFVKIWRARAWRGLRNEKAYVARIAWRAAVDRLRGDRPSIRKVSGTAEPNSAIGATREQAAVEDVADSALSPEAMVVAGDWEAAVHRLIDSLPDELRQVLALSVEMNSREIAAAMGIAEGTVRTRLMRAREVLREKMVAMEARRYARR